MGRKLGQGYWVFHVCIIANAYTYQSVMLAICERLHVALARMDCMLAYVRQCMHVALIAGSAAWGIRQQPRLA